MSDSWYSRALARAQPQTGVPQARYAGTPAYPQAPSHTQLSTPAHQQPPAAIPDEMLPAEMRWANKLVGAARSALQHGQGHVTDRDPCPRCGSPQFFARATSKRMPPPAPHCYNCGYNDGMFEQGLESSWVGAQP